MIHPIRTALLTLSLSALFSPCFGSVAYDETVSGDSSTNFTSPTNISLNYGSNQILGSTGRVAGVVDRDYFTFTLSQYQRLASITVLANTTGDGSGAQTAFISIQSGNTGTNPATAQIPLAASLLGYYLFGPADIGQDILDNMAASNSAFIAAQGFTAPLNHGTYTVWIQETANPINYGFNLQVVPEPESLMLMGLGLAGLAFTKRKNSLAAA